MSVVLTSRELGCYRTIQALTKKWDGTGFEGGSDQMTLSELRTAGLQVCPDRQWS